MQALGRAILLLCCLLILPSCLEEQMRQPDTEFVFPDLLSEQRMNCEREGGRWGATPTGGSVCFRNLSDAGKLCRKESDCQGVCLARSRTCAPITPFYGCHEVFSESGYPQTLCIE